MFMHMIQVTFSRTSLFLGRKSATCYQLSRVFATHTCT
nr:MAG TPA: hypothetical protein [Caudoviricetes sp.]